MPPHAVLKAAADVLLLIRIVRRYRTTEEDRDATVVESASMLNGKLLCGSARHFELILGLLLLSTAALAQDLVAVAPQAAKVEYEDARFRIVRLKIAPNETLAMHDRPYRVIIPLTPGDARLTLPDGRTSISRTQAGHVTFSGPGKRSVTNVGDAIENVLIEFKKIDAPGKPLSQPPDPKPANYLDDPFHHWLLENQYVRIYDARVPPGATTAFHLHALDTVRVVLSGQPVSTQIEGKDWSPSSMAPTGSALYMADSAKPYKHRLRNDGKGEYHVIIVQLLQ